MVVVIMEPITCGYLRTTQVFDMDGHDGPATLSLMLFKGQLYKTKISIENKGDSTHLIPTLKTLQCSTGTDITLVNNSN